MEEPCGVNCLERCGCAGLNDSCQCSDLPQCSRCMEVGGTIKWDWDLMRRMSKESEANDEGRIPDKPTGQ